MPDEAFDRQLLDAEDRLRKADEGNTEFQARKEQTLAELKDEATTVREEYHAAHEAVEGLKRQQAEQGRQAAAARGEDVPPHQTIGGAE